MVEVDTRPWRFREFRDPIFLLVTFTIWLIWPNSVFVFIFGAYGVFYLIAVLLKGRRYDGEIIVSKRDTKTIFGVSIAIPPEHLSLRNEVIFKVVQDDRTIDTPYNEDNIEED